MTSLSPDLEHYLDGTTQQRLDRFVAFLRIPSISGIPEHAADCRRAADHLAGVLGAVGMEHVEVSETGGHPVVYADWLHADGAPTVLLYGHYDVQPVDPLDEWEAAPFEPVVRDGRILARGASDDKSNITAAVAAAEALLATRGVLPVNLKLVFEGEEESSSVHLDAWLAANAARLGADVALVADGGFFEGNLPAVTVGLRGICAAEIHVRGPFQDVHSGVHGGRSRTRSTRSRRSSRPSRDPTAGSASRASTTTSSRSRRPIARPSRRSPSTRTPIGPSSMSRRSWERRAGPPWSGAGPGRRST